MLRDVFTVGNLVTRLKNVIRGKQMKEEANRGNIKGVLLEKRRTTAMIFDYSQLIVLFQHQKEMRTIYGMSILAILTHDR